MKPFLALLAISLLLGGCAQFLRPEQDLLDPALAGAVPDRWSALSGAAEGDPTGWLDDLGSERLHRLVHQALESNPDLRESVARVRSAEARARMAGADRLPTLGADFDAGRSQRLRGVGFERTKADQFNLGLSSSWEIDLWGRLANRRASATKALEATVAELAAARFSLAADVARSAVVLFEAEQQVALARENLASLEANLEILDDNLEAGVADERMGLDISLARADVARSKATVQSNLRSADTARRRLEILLGGYPEGEIAALEAFPEVLREVPSGLPSELLLRRPDLIAAELRADAALDDIAASRKALLPSLRLTGGVGTSTTDDFNLLLDERALVWNIAGTLAQQIFQGGRLRASIEEARAEAEVVAARYARSALQAFSEVESTLAAEAYYLAQEEQLRIASTEAERAAGLAVSQYENGLVEILTVLDSQRRAFDARRTLLSITSERIRNRIDLYLALGGDFEGR